MNRLQRLSCGIASALLLPFAIPAAIADDEVPTVLLPGKTASGAWHSLDQKTIPFAVNDVQPWPDDLPAQSGDARFLFRKEGGSAYAIAVGLYSGGAEYTGPLLAEIMAGKLSNDDLKRIQPSDFSNLGAFRVSTEAPLEKLQTVVLLVRLRGLPPGEHFTAFELITKAFPVVLRYNGKHELAPVQGKLLSSRVAGGFHEEVYALQWDLSSVPDPVSRYSIHWKVYPHAATTGVRVQEADSFNRNVLGVVPLLGHTAP